MPHSRHHCSVLQFTDGTGTRHMPTIGTRQSPISIHTKDSLPLSDPKNLLSVNYTGKSVSGVFRSHNFELSPWTATPAYPQVIFRGTHYFDLRRIHIHVDSEHLIDGKPSKFEVHLLHLPTGIGPLTPELVLEMPKLVIGILYREDGSASSTAMESLNAALGDHFDEEGNPTEFLDDPNFKNAPIPPIDKWDLLPQRTKPNHVIEPSLFFPSNGADVENWFHYEGSLTSEIYSEDVHWFVMRDESSVDPAKIKRLKKFAHQHARPIYPIDGRIIVRSFP